MDLKKIVELAMKLYLSAESRKAWIHDQDKKFREIEKEERAEKRRHEIEMK